MYVMQGGEYKGYVLVQDELKEDSQRAVREMKDAGVKEIVMLTGDNREVAMYVAEKLDITQTYYELLPGDKVDKMEEIYTTKSEKGILAYVGDGINDAPVLARADVGIAMGDLGSDAAIEAADVVIMTDEPSKIAMGIRIARKTLGIVKQNIVFALAVKLAILILAAMGAVGMWAAIFADVGVAVIAILNAMRAMNVNGLKSENFNVATR